MTAERTSGNVFLDIGFGEGEAEELAVKADLITSVSKAIDSLGLTQEQAAKICGTHQTSLSKILSGKLGSITIDRLTKWIVALGGSVEISVSQPKGGKTGKPRQRGSLSIQAQ